MNNIKYILSKEKIILCKLIEKNVFVIVNDKNKLFKFNLKTNKFILINYNFIGNIFNILLINDNELLIQTNLSNIYFIQLKNNNVSKIDLEFKYDSFEKIKEILYTKENDIIKYKPTNLFYIITKDLYIFNYNNNFKEVINLENKSLIIYSKCLLVQKSMYFLITFNENEEIFLILINNKTVISKNVIKKNILVKKIYFYNDEVLIFFENLVEIYKLNKDYNIELKKKIEVIKFENVKKINENYLFLNFNLIYKIFDFNDMENLKKYKLVNEKIIKIIEYSKKISYIITKEYIIIINNSIIN